MTIVTTVVSVDRRYLDKKPKRWLLQTYEHLTRKRLTIEEWNALMAKRQWELASMVWDVWSKLPV